MATRYSRMTSSVSVGSRFGGQSLPYTVAAFSPAYTSAHAILRRPL